MRLDEVPPICSPPGEADGPVLGRKNTPLLTMLPLLDTDVVVEDSVQKARSSIPCEPAGGTVENSFGALQTT